MLTESPEDWSTVVLADADELVAEALARPPDTIVVDMGADERVAFALLARLRATEELEGVPVIALVGADQSDVKVRALEAGASDLLNRPFLAEDLILRISAALRLKAVQDDLKAQNEALRESEERYSVAAHGANDGIWDWNLKTGEVYYSPRWKLLLGYEEDEVGQGIDEWFNRMHPEEVDQTTAEIHQHLIRRTSNFENEHRLRHKDGTFRWFLVRGTAVWDRAGRATRMAGSLTDITRRKMAEARLVYDATHDSLTGLLNRGHIMELLAAEVQGARRYGYSLSLCLCDLDEFKSVNDMHGHHSGDDLLAAFGKLLTAGLRAQDVAGRYGGDEFIIIFPHTDAKGAAVSMERIRLRLAKLVLRSEAGAEFSVTGTFGIAQLHASHDNEKALVTAADQALYEAKEAGRNRVLIHASGPAAGG